LRFFSSKETIIVAYTYTSLRAKRHYNELTKLTMTDRTGNFSEDLPEAVKYEY